METDIVSKSSALAGKEQPTWMALSILYAESGRLMGPGESTTPGEFQDPPAPLAQMSI
jgi:hypothetical protein